MQSAPKHTVQTVDPATTRSFVSASTPTRRRRRDIHLQPRPRVQLSHRTIHSITMASHKKDMRRVDLSKPSSRSMGLQLAMRADDTSQNTMLTRGLSNAVIPYQEPAAKKDASEFSSTLSSTLPMAAIFMRNRYVGW